MQTFKSVFLILIFLAAVSLPLLAQYDNSASDYVVLPEVVWAPATGGGNWVTEVQITEVQGPTVVRIYVNYGGGNFRGDFVLWTSTGGGESFYSSNILSYIQTSIDPGFTYFGRVVSIDFFTENASQRIHVAARIVNGNYSKTCQGLNWNAASNYASTAQTMMIQNLVNNATYRSTVGVYEATGFSVTVDFYLYDGNGNPIGSSFSKTLVGYDFKAFYPFNEAGRPYPSYSYNNAYIWIVPVSGSGAVMCFGASANNKTNDPGGHIAVQAD